MFINRRSLVYSNFDSKSNLTMLKIPDFQFCLTRPIFNLHADAGAVHELFKMLNLVNSLLL
jgi:hypothetical protein